MDIAYYIENLPKSLVLPRTCFELERLIKEPSSTVGAFADVIAIDASLASKLLKLANSALYGRRMPITTIDQAVKLIGFNQIHELALTDLASSAFKQLASRNIDIERFWQMSVFRGLCSKHLAQFLKLPQIERHFVCGLTKDLGELLVYRITPELAMGCQERHSTGLLPWHAQQEILGFSYAQLTAQLLKGWQLPPQIIIPIAHVNQAHDIEINNDIKVLYIASRLAVCQISQAPFTYEAVLDEAMCQELNLSIIDVRYIAACAYEEMAHIISILKG